jgi:hypothetical protein
LQIDTKPRGDIAEQATILHALKRSWGILKLVGDRLAYDFVFNLKYKCKYAWFDEASGNYVVTIAAPRQIRD